MITDLEKKEIDKKYFPNGLPYQIPTVENFNYSNSKQFDEQFETLQAYEASVRSLRHINAIRFFNLIKKKINETEFINEINNQYLNYTLENTENSIYWLNLTYDLVLKGFTVVGKIEDINLRGAFIKWYNTTIKDSQPQQNKPKTENNPFPLMFVNENVYSCFLDYKKHIIEVHTDYSYLKKRLEKLKLIHKHTDNDFMNFLLNDIKFISKKDFENYTYKYESKLKSLSKSYSEQRENNFNIVFENLL